MQIGRAASRAEARALGVEEVYRLFSHYNLIYSSSRIQTRLSRGGFYPLFVEGGDSISRGCRTTESELSRATVPGVTVAELAL